MLVHFLPSYFILFSSLFKAIRDLSHASTLYLAHLQSAVQQAYTQWKTSSNANDVSNTLRLGALTAPPLPERTFETWAWTAGTASKLLLRGGGSGSGPFGELVVSGDKKLLMHETKSLVAEGVNLDLSAATTGGIAAEAAGVTIEAVLSLRDPSSASSSSSLAPGGSSESDAAVVPPPPLGAVEGSMLATYRAKLEEVMKVTPESHADYQGCAALLANVDAVLYRIENTVREISTFRCLLVSQTCPSISLHRSLCF